MWFRTPAEIDFLQAGIITKAIGDRRRSSRLSPANYRLALAVACVVDNQENHPSEFPRTEYGFTESLHHCHSTQNAALRQAVARAIIHPAVHNAGATRIAGFIDNDLSMQADAQRMIRGIKDVSFREKLTMGELEILQFILDHPSKHQTQYLINLQLKANGQYHHLTDEMQKLTDAVFIEFGEIQAKRFDRFYGEIENMVREKVRPRVGSIFSPLEWARLSRTRTNRENIAWPGSEGERVPAMSLEPALSQTSPREPALQH